MRKSHTTSLEIPPIREPRELGGIRGMGQPYPDEPISPIILSPLPIPRNTADIPYSRARVFSGFDI
jgi:hypothetical protein